MSTFDPCPCHYCVAPKRHPGCHDTCTKEYIPWKAREDARKAAATRNAVSDAYVADIISRNRNYVAVRKQKSRRTIRKAR